MSCLTLSSHRYLGLSCDLLVRGFHLNIFVTLRIGLGVLNVSSVSNIFRLNFTAEILSLAGSLNLVFTSVSRNIRCVVNF